MSPTPNSKKWMIYGATGYTGKAIAIEAAARGLHPILAGRNHLELHNLGKTLGLESRVFELENLDECVGSITDCDVVLHCAGPFSQTSAAMLNACLKAHTHYLDITGEISVFESIHAQDEAIKNAGIIAMPGVGFDVVPSDCLSALLQQKLPGATSLELAIKSTPQNLSPGTTNTIIEHLRHGSAIRINGEINKIKPFSILKTLTFSGRPTLMTAIPWGDISTAWRTTSIPNIKVFMPVNPRNLRILKLARHFSFLTRISPLRRYIQKRVRLKIPGPTPEQRSTGKTEIWGQVTDPYGTTETMLMTTPEAYRLTLDAAIKIVSKILNLPYSPPLESTHLRGALTPVMAFGPDLYRDMEGVTVETLMAVVESKKTKKNEKKTSGATDNPNAPFADTSKQGTSDMSTSQPMIKPESEIKIARMFDLIAQRYDFLNGLLSARQDRKWRKKLLSCVPKAVNGTFVDVATGTGDVILGAKSKRPEYSHFIGVDISNNMLDLAKDKAREKNIPMSSASSNGIRFQNMSAESLQIPDSSVDCLSISFGLRNVIDKERAIAEFYRVLKPGGTLLILEFFMPQTGSLAPFFQFYFHKVLPRIGGFFSNAEAYSYLPKSVGSFYSPQELKLVLDQQKVPTTHVTSWLFGSCRLIAAKKN